MCSEHAPDGSRTHQGPQLSSPPECHRALLPAFHPHGHTFLPELAPPVEPLPANILTPMVGLRPPPPAPISHQCPSPPAPLAGDQPMALASLLACSPMPGDSHHLLGASQPTPPSAPSSWQDPTPNTNPSPSPTTSSPDPLYHPGLGSLPVHPALAPAAGHKCPSQTCSPHSRWGPEVLGGLQSQRGGFRRTSEVELTRPRDLPD